MTETISGTVELAGNAQDGVTVYLINESTRTIEDRTETDGSGSYTLETERDGNYIIVPSYHESSGDEWHVATPVANALARPRHKGFVGRWPMSEGSGETVADSVNDYDASYAYDEWRSGGIGGHHIRLTGGFDRVNLPETLTDPIIDLMRDQSFSLGAWFNIDDIDFGSASPIFGFREDDEQSIYFRVDNDGDLSFRAADNVGGLASTDGLELEEGEWYHIAVVLDSNTIRMYVDAKEVLAEDYEHDLPDETDGGSLSWGNDADSSTDGYIDDAWISDIPFTHKDIIENYNENKDVHHG
ncbi:uncharacterized protein Nmag_1633 [Natrialba magadii ATCC 43099]|uniref:Uncharacterized protein n=1 Tax=Natrialba magadii (strain ATCC 43099 / DSM 3394 / CCM 3739 / CIP 104546 / IAM 13178 / JCM 8861 / NBRC 102185 / NCIMB 2190 / MS3) TaxID=547559 RepID=D3SUF1_NATMM|nr:LamG-like jellyroll fold domain-containing protein [Natrialba magadii]ADD05209.1 uncharacterized protein Nmag_1633 [Natrialba magadii ATCC 43099]ELY23245.1 hypothetical protein C500_20686 [Natrialba magadii ATCC 43099]